MIGSSLHIFEDVQDIRCLLGGLSLAELVQGGASEEVLMRLRTLLDVVTDGSDSLPISQFILHDCFDGSLPNWGVQPSVLRQWATDQFQVSDFALSILTYILLILFPTNSGISIQPNAVRLACPELQFDDDGLVDLLVLDGQPSKEGVLIGPHYLKYSPWIDRYNLNLQLGFLDLFTLIGQLERSALWNYRLRLDSDVVLPRQLHKPMYHRVRVWGPIGFTEEQLSDPHFPELATGTRTEHARDEDRVHVNYLGMDLERLQVMWSARDGIKIVQIEELLPIDAKEFRHRTHIANRYVHAEWDPQKNAFRHFDGAVKIYAKEQYMLRRAEGLKRSDSRLPKVPKPKLFRMDGKIRPDDFSLLTASFFKDNELVEEYLGGRGDGVQALMAGFKERMSRFNQRLKSQ
jgi:hypothetical protein